MFNMIYLDLYMSWLRWFLYGDSSLVPVPDVIELEDVSNPSGELIGQGFISAPFLAK